MGRFRGLVSLPVLVLALTALSSHAQAAVSPSLKRHPYLTDLVGSAATVNFATDRSAPTAEVRWGRVGQDLCASPPNPVPASRTPIVVNSVLQYQWKAMLELAPDTEYCYRVYLGSAQNQIDLLQTDPSPLFQSQLPPGSPKPFSFAVFGDWGDMDRVPHQENVLTQVAASGVNFAVTTGDNTYDDGTQTNQGDLVQTGFKVSGVFAPQFWGKVGASTALFQAVGNHDMDEGNLVIPPGFDDCADPNNSTVSTILLNWPQDRAVSSSGGRYCAESYSGAGTLPEEYPSAWYAFDVGVARFYVLQAAWTRRNSSPNRTPYETDFDLHWDTSSPLGRRQYDWLARDLAANPRALKFAFFHYPLYSDNAAQGSDTFLHGAGRLEGLLQQHSVDLVFNGHAHNYQRNHPDPTGMVSYVTGGGGGGNRQIGPTCGAYNAYGIGWNHQSVPERGSACGAAPVPSSADQTYHFLLVTVNGSRVTVTPIDELGRTFDAATYDFPSPPPAPPFPSPPRASVADRSAPSQRLRARKIQDVDRLLATVRVNEPADLTARATVNVAGASRVLRFRTVRRTARANRVVKLRFKLATKRLRTVKRALARGKKLRARISVTAADRSRNRATRRVTVRLRP